MGAASSRQNAFPASLQRNDEPPPANASLAQPQELGLGFEWFVDAHDCDPAALRSLPTLQALFERLQRELALRAVGEPHWHVFAGEGGITGLVLLTESHLACHTYPERGFAALNLYCCQARPEWPWQERLRESLAARRVVVRRLDRGTSPA